MHRRFLRQLDIFKRTWPIHAVASGIERTTSGFPTWHLEAEGPDWQTHTTFELLAWDDLISKDQAGSRVVRLVRAITAYLELLFTGTLLRYVKANSRYFLFALTPILEIAVLAAVAWAGSISISRQFGAPALLECAAHAILGWALFLALLEWPGRRWRIYQALDDWVLSLDYIHGRRAELEHRLDAFAERFVECARDEATDEIIVVGHSLGATFAVDAVARALGRYPGFGKRRPLSVLTVGATIPKCALHPAAERTREQIRIVSESAVHWAEFQSRADPISFYRFHPVTLTRLTERGDRLSGNPVIRRIHIKDMLNTATFNRYRFRVLRLHYQFVSANDRRAPYDYFMMICGPIPLPVWTKSELGFLDFFRNAQNASLTDMSTQVAR
jgi:hypothetical protein